MIRVKICGLTNLDDALAAAHAGADALGFVFAPSPRQISPQKAREIIAALPPMVITVGVFQNAHPEEVSQVRRYCGLSLVQLHGEETESETACLGPGVIKALSVGKTPPDPLAYPMATLLLDTAASGKSGGTGLSFDWGLAAPVAAQRPVILAGGLNPDNVAQAILVAGPCAVDVSSGVESAPGRKDHDQIARFIASAKGLALAA